MPSDLALICQLRLKSVRLGLCV